ncbi:hypothetical protein FRB99_007825 [Tulasnella sp. 403]|nr:hypothetical protein FRB99_007825 [Tulasnella sp. 403]
MGVFQRKPNNSTSRSPAKQPSGSASGSTAVPKSSSTKALPPRPTATPSLRASSNTKRPKPSKPSLAQRVSVSLKPAPKPQPTLIRRATMGLSGLSEFNSSQWEKRMMKRLQKFPEDHPILAKVLGAGLCLAAAGAGAVAMPALMAAVTVGGASTLLGGAAAAAAGAAVQETAVGAALAAGAKIFLSKVALDVGEKLLKGDEPPAAATTSTQRPSGVSSARKERSNSTNSDAPKSESSNPVGTFVGRSLSLLVAKKK